MRKFLALALFTAYSLTFVGSSAAMALGQTLKVKIVHSHDHESGDDHHHETDEPTPDENKSESNPHSSNQHSHEISVGSSLVMTTSEYRLDRVVVLVDKAQFPALKQRVPKSPALLGIFRPPIV